MFVLCLTYVCRMHFCILIKKTKKIQKNLVNSKICCTFAVDFEI